MLPKSVLVAAAMWRELGVNGGSDAGLISNANAQVSQRSLGRCLKVEACSQSCVDGTCGFLDGAGGTDDELSLILFWVHHA